MNPYRRGSDSNPSIPSNSPDLSKQELFLNLNYDDEELFNYPYKRSNSVEQQEHYQLAQSNDDIISHSEAMNDFELGQQKSISNNAVCYTQDKATIDNQSDLREETFVYRKSTQHLYPQQETFLDRQYNFVNDQPLVSPSSSHTSSVAPLKLGSNRSSEDLIWHVQTENELRRTSSRKKSFSISESTRGQGNSVNAATQESQLVEVNNTHKKKNKPYDNMMSILAPSKK
jgi:hypothetical protein